jgi:NAD(P)H dehydrogenase (quinone)
MTRRRVLVIACHPDPASFHGAILGRVVDGLESGGDTVRVRDLYAEGFSPKLRRDEHARHLEPPETKPDIADHVADLRWCDTLVFVYPTWWSGQPAMLKGWFDRVLVRGVAWELPPGANRLQPGLRNVRRIIVVTTHGSPKWVNALQGEAGKRTITRGVRVLCRPFTRTRWIALYGLDTAADARRARFLARVERIVSR